MRENVTASKQYAEEARGLVEDIKANRDEAELLVGALLTQSGAEDPEEVKRTLEDTQNNPEASLIDKAIANALDLQQQGKLDDAIEKWQAIARIAEENDPDLAARAWFSVGYLGRDKNPEDCIFAYDQAIRLNPNDSAAFNNRGTTYIKLRRYLAALADYDQAISLDSGQALVYMNRGTRRSS